MSMSKTCMRLFLWMRSQSWRSAKLFSSRRNRDSPNPSPAGECAPFPSVQGGGAHALAIGERGGGRVSIPTRGHPLAKVPIDHLPVPIRSSDCIGDTIGRFKIPIFVSGDFIGASIGLTLKRSRFFECNSILQQVSAVDIA